MGTTGAGMRDDYVNNSTRWRSDVFCSVSRDERERICSHSNVSYGKKLIII